MGPLKMTPAAKINSKSIPIISHWVNVWNYWCSEMFPWNSNGIMKPIIYFPANCHFAITFQSVSFDDFIVLLYIQISCTWSTLRPTSYRMFGIHLFQKGKRWLQNRIKWVLFFGLGWNCYISKCDVTLMLCKP